MVIGLIGLWLIAISFYDIRYRKIPLVAIVIGFLISALVCVKGGIERQIEIKTIAMSLTPGVLLLLLSLGTGLVGYADGLILACLGLPIGISQCFGVLMMALVGIGIYSAVLLAIGKATKKTRLPFVPFLTIAWLVTVMGGIQGR